MARTPKRDVRVSDESWERWKAAAAPGSVSGLIHDAVEEFIGSGERRPAGAPTRVTVTNSTAEGVVEGVAAGVKVERAKRSRAERCVHRVPATAYCSRCDA